MVANDLLQGSERYVLEGLMAIRGSRNGVFWANAIAIVIWRDRACRWLSSSLPCTRTHVCTHVCTGTHTHVHMHLLVCRFLEHKKALAAAKREKEGGLTRDYLLAMLSEPAIISCLHSMALLYLEFYLPFMSALTHLNDATDELADLGQASSPVVQ